MFDYEKRPVYPVSFLHLLRKIMGLSGGIIDNCHGFYWNFYENKKYLQL